MCGIVGIVSSGRDVAADLVEGMRRLEYRGYDSCGVALPGESSLSVTKDVGGPSKLLERDFFANLSASLGIAHTRWATHGGVSKANAHPHLSSDGRVAIVHNGVLDNYRELREELRARGHVFESETDSEVAVRLLEEALPEHDDPREAILSVARQLKGIYAIAVLVHGESDRLWALRQESPLLIGGGPDAVVLASDSMALSADCDWIVHPMDGDLVEITADDCKVFRIETGAPVERSREASEGMQVDPEIGGYDNYMEKEMAESAEASAAALAIPDAVIEEAARGLVDADRAFLTGMGTAYHMAMLGQYLLAGWAGRYCPVVTADEVPELIDFTASDVILGVSQSGETYDTLRALREAKGAGARTQAVCNVPTSSMARSVDHVVLQGTGPEIAVLATKSALSQALIMSRIALEVARQVGRFDESTHADHLRELESFPGVVDEWRERIDEQSREVAARFLGLEKWFFLGRGVYAPVAMEGALKFKEVTYRHAEGMAAGFLKHGTISLIDSEMGAAMFVPPPACTELRALTMTALEEVRSRGGPVLAVGALKGDELSLVDACIQTPGRSLLLDALLQVVVGQYLSYHTARALGRDVDKPRALAKSVTVP